MSRTWAEAMAAAPEGRLSPEDWGRHDHRFLCFEVAWQFEEFERGWDYQSFVEFGLVLPRRFTLTLRLELLGRE
jgi:hypothetical protein